MLFKDRDLYVQDLVKSCLHILNSKGVDYARGSEDVNANFKELGASVDIIWTGREGKYITWWVYFMKHWFALRSWFRSGALASEPIEERIKDLINYLLILYCLIKEDKLNEEKNSTNSPGLEKEIKNK
jgi:hypothetical protein